MQKITRGNDIENNDTGGNEYKSIPSINRSLPATPMVGINATSRALTIGNFSLNAELESPESKLCGKIMATKSNFTDKFPSLKNETTVNIKQDYNINTEEIAALKNKIKLLELENKHLKGDVTNKN